MVRAMCIHPDVAVRDSSMEAAGGITAWPSGQDEVDACSVVVDPRPRGCAPAGVGLLPAAQPAAFDEQCIGTGEARLAVVELRYSASEEPIWQQRPRAGRVL